MLSTTIIPNTDPHRTLAPAAPREGFADSDALRTPHGPAAARTAAMPATTPPPRGELSFPGSDWSSDGDGLPTNHRAPRIGDTVMGFKLVGELGRGAFARDRKSVV